jgi:uncharacterized damage-inducible protein DinB
VAAHEPGRHAAPGPERWVGYLEWLREETIATVLALPEEERRTTRLPSGWTPVELLSHLLHMEQRWFVWGFLGDPVDTPWGDWDVPDPGAVPDDADPPPRWSVPDDVTAEALAERLRAVGGRTASVLRDHSLETPGAVGGRFAADPPTLEWICFHVLVEYARHAGHLDVVTELGRG